MKLTFLIGIIVAILLGVPFVSYAQNQPSGGGGTTVAIPNPLCSGNQSCGLTDIIQRILTFLLQVAVPLATLVVLWAGFLFMTAGGSEERIKTAKRALWSAVVGIGILLLATGIVNVIKSILS